MKIATGAIALVLLLLRLSCSSACDTGAGRRGLAEDGHKRFGYDDSKPNGPSHWADLDPAWQICKTGRQQSPIALKTNLYSPTISRALDWRYDSRRRNASIRKTEDGIDIEVTKGWGSFTVLEESRKIRFDFYDLHFHYPSEHTIDGVRSDLELHMVHMDDVGRIAVVGVLFNASEKHADDPFLDQFFSLLPKLGNEPINTSVKRLDIGKRASYWRYQGSLTTPPCEQGVTWTVMNKVRGMSAHQLHLYKQTVPKPNSRPVQKLYDRKVYNFGVKGFEKVHL